MVSSYDGIDNGIPCQQRKDKDVKKVEINLLSISRYRRTAMVRLMLSTYDISMTSDTMDVGCGLVQIIVDGEGELHHTKQAHDDNGQQERNVPADSSFKVHK